MRKRFHLLISSMALIVFSSAIYAANKAPMIILHQAPPLELPAHPDSNSPSFWFGDQFYQFVSRNISFLSWGPNYQHLSSLIEAPIVSQKPGYRWIEATGFHNGYLWALYHLEHHSQLCADRPYFTIPEIGLARSADLGRSWQDLGIILKDNIVADCASTPNEYFAGGVGDASWILSESRGAAHIFYSAYSGNDPQKQGIQLARIELKHFDQPVGHVWRWTQSGFTAPGIDGEGASILPAKASWATPEPDAFWGPSVHWNVYLKKYVLLLNRAIDPSWKQEGIYITFLDNLDQPQCALPQKIHDGGKWYPQVIGDPQMGGTDSLAGKISRLFIFGRSDHMIEFE